MQPRRERAGSKSAAGLDALARVIVVVSMTVMIIILIILMIIIIVIVRVVIVIISDSDSNSNDSTMGRWLPTARRRGLGSRRPRQCPNCWLALEQSLGLTLFESCQHAPAPFLRLFTPKASPQEYASCARVQISSDIVCCVIRYHSPSHELVT